MRRQTITVAGESIDRARIEQLLQEDTLLVFDDCDFSGERRLATGVGAVVSKCHECKGLLNTSTVPVAAPLLAQ